MNNLESTSNTKQTLAALTDDNIRLLIGEKKESIELLQNHIADASDAVEDAHWQITQLLTGKINWLNQRTQQPESPETWCALDTSHPIRRYDNY